MVKLFKKFDSDKDKEQKPTNFRFLANKILTKHTNYEIADIAKCQLIHKGYTNVSYHLIMEDGVQLQIRIGNDGGAVNRDNEIEFLTTINNKDFIYIDKKTGNAIKRWIEGNNPSNELASKLSTIKKVNQAINELHEVKVNPFVITHDFKEFINVAPSDENIKQKYLELVEKYKDEKLVMSHNDINPNNLLITNDGEIHLIDYEWARLNHEYWDLANYLREINIKTWKLPFVCWSNHLNLKKLKDYIFLATCYAYQWTFCMPKTDKMLKYQKMVNERTKFYLKKFY